MEMYVNTADCQEVPRWKTVEEARRLTTDLINAHFLAALTAHERAGLGVIEKSGQALSPLALRISPGVGKSHVALEQLARFGPHFLAHGHVIFCCPTLDLAQEAADTLRVMNGALPITVMRGRGAANPASGQPMCQKHELARAISGFVPSVRAALCRGRDANGKMVEAPCAAGCPWLAQIDAAEARPQIIFAAHAYLTSGLPIRGPRALTIIDERFWQEMTSTKRIPLDDWLAPAATGMTAQQCGRAMLLRATVLQALEACAPVIDAVKAAGLTETDLVAMARAERATIDAPTITPDMPAVVADALMGKFDRRAAQRARARAAVLDLLAERWPHPSTERLSLGAGAKGGGRAIMLHKCRTLSDEVPILLLDADADALILSAVAPQARVVRVDVRPQAEIIQINDLTCSGTWLLGERNRMAGLEAASRIIAREAGRGRTLLVATKPVLARLAEMAGMKVANGLPAQIDIAGAEARWFGPRMLGVNRYADFDSIVVLGRQQPPVAAIEDEMRCLFGDEVHPLTFLPDGRLVAGKSPLLHADGRLTEMRAQIHPDPRAMAILRQLREYMTSQAIARLRLMAPDRPKRVIILSNIPLPDLPVDHLCPLADVARGGPPDPHEKKRPILAHALGSADFPPVEGLRLSAGGLAEDLPQAFPTVSSAKEFRRNLDTATLRQLVEELAAARGWPCAFVELRDPAGRKPVPAMVFFGRELPCI